MCCSPWCHRVQHNLATEQQQVLIPEPHIANYWAKYWFEYSAAENVFLVCLCVPFTSHLCFETLSRKINQNSLYQLI